MNNACYTHINISPCQQTTARYTQGGDFDEVRQESQLSKHIAILHGGIFIAQKHRFHRHAVKDRKSTRLNSSNVAISYAVCCLKKKRRYRKRTRDLQSRHDIVYRIV